MKSLISIIFLSIILTHCGFKPIYNSNSSNFEVIEIINKNKNKNSFTIEKMIMSLSNQGAKKKVKLELNYEHLITTILKDSKGDPLKNKLITKIKLVVNDDQNNLISTKNFNEDFDYSVQDNKFNMKQYEQNIRQNLIEDISGQILSYLSNLQ